MSIMLQNIKYKNIVPNMTSNTSPSPYVVSATHSVDKDAYLVFDGNKFSHIRSSILTYMQVPWYLQIDLGQNNEQVVCAYQLECFIYAGWTMKAWTLESSNDNSTWTILHSVTGMTWDYKTTYSFQFENTIAYRYYRFRCTATNGQNSVCLSSVRLLALEESNLEFAKCLEENLPQQRSSVSDCIYFTEKGNIYMTKKDGTLKKMGGNSGGAINGEYVNTKLDYFSSYSYYPDGSHQDITEIFSLNNIDSNMQYNKVSNAITLTKDKTYSINASVRISELEDDSIRYGQLDFYIKDITHDILLPIAGTVYVANADVNWSDHQLNGIYTPTENIDICLYAAYKSNIKKYAWLNFNIFEIGRQTIVDPIKYTNENQGIEDIPIGHIMSYMGNNVPKHYLPCDGSIYFIVDYPYLAEHILNEFGSYNYFGGDGEDTFAVPDLRGEFLRGTGTATRDSGSGAKVGEHQDGTLFTDVGYPSGGTSRLQMNITVTSQEEAEYTKYADKRINRSGYVYAQATKTEYSSSTENSGPFTARPTNTSVLYCIKYEPTYYIVINNNEELKEMVNQLSIILDEINGEVV